MLDAFGKVLFVPEVIGDFARVPIGHEEMESLLDVAVETDACDEVGDVAAFLKFEVEPSVSVLIEVESIFAAAVRSEGVGTV